jgi:hypothetical protein
MDRHAEQLQRESTRLKTIIGDLTVELKRATGEAPPDHG